MVVEFLYKPQQFFSQRSIIPFFSGFSSVFLNGGITFLLALITVLSIQPGGMTASEIFVSEGVIFVLGVTFSSTFVLWFAIAGIFYLHISLVSRKLRFFTVLSFSGIGFIPLAIGSIIEFFLTIVSLDVVTSEPDQIVTHVLIAGEAPLILTVIMWVIWILMLLWSGYVWAGALVGIATISRAGALSVSTMVIVILAIELILLANIDIFVSA